MKNKRIIFAIMALVISSYGNAQTIEETVDYINSKTEKDDKIRVYDDILDTKIGISSSSLSLSNINLSIKEIDGIPYISIECKEINRLGFGCIKFDHVSSSPSSYDMIYSMNSQAISINIDDGTRYTCEKVINALYHLGKLLEERKNNELKRREQNANQRPQHDNDPFAPQNYNK